MMNLYTYRGKYWICETSCGTEIVPFDVESDSTRLESLVEGEIEDLPELREGWYGRYSAPGYLDCTPWHWAESEAALVAELKGLYGDDEDEEEVCADE